ncbi:MAG: glutamine--fructose-6-phosphate transaminase (isomerizing) [Thermoplasmata archaeon]|nr:MAG: glutamine--fructose-6-phosphate transaminase (isomerizing) [Thermoplasmata archaeon]
MCGIVGYIGWRRAIDPLIASLKKLEYRGYDSAGIAVIGSDLYVYKTEGTIDKLEKMLPNIDGNFGIAHTRWATHGKPTDYNAHPMVDCKGEIAVVHNGIIENYRELKEELMARGHKFTSETDTEVIPHLIEESYNGDLLKACMEAVKKLRGTYAIVAISKNEERLVAARKENPLIVGVAEGENFVASDIPALLKYTRRVMYVMDGEFVDVRKDGVRIYDSEGNIVQRDCVEVDLSIEDAEKGGYEHFMLKEIFEQPRAIRDSLLGRIAELELNGIVLADYDIIKIIGCGTSYHAGLVGKYIIEGIADVPVIAEMASEYRYSSKESEDSLVILISQSGETADTLAAAREARRRGARTVAITNVMGSSLTREADAVIYTRAGIEIGVAATKSFTTQLITLYLIALRAAEERGALTPGEIEEYKNKLRLLPHNVAQVLDRADIIKRKVEMFDGVHSAFFIGRHINYPIALEGALKMKEISYIHAEGYPAGELKHGPLALLTEKTPIVAIAVKDHTYDKMIGNIREVSARSSPVLGVAFDGDRNIQKFVDDVIYVPEVEPVLSPVPVIVALQLLAYYVAKDRGCPIDKPRNLAKSVTVE